MSRDDRRLDHAADLPDEPARFRGGLVVEPARPATPAGSVALLAGVALAAAVVALAVAGLFSPVTPPIAPSSPGAALGSGSSGSPLAVPSATLPVHDVRSGDAAVAELARLVGWTTCPVWREFGIDTPVTRADVEAAVSASGVDAGLVNVTDASGHVQRVWVASGTRGGGVDVAVAGFGGTVIVRDADTVWTVVVERRRPGEGGRAVAVRLEAGVRQAGGTFWQIRGRASLAPYCNGSVGFDGPVRVVRVLAAGQERLFAEAGWVGCKTWYRTGRTVVPEPGRIEAAGRAAGLGPDASGWVDLLLGEGYGAASMQTWFGRDEEEAARAHGSSLMVVEDGGTPTAWLRVEFGGREIAVQFRIIETPEGRKAWLATPNASGIVSSCEAAG